MSHIYTVEMARKILQLDDDFDSEMIELYLDVAEGQIKTQTGYDFTNKPNDPDAKDYVRKSILMQHYSSDSYNKEFDFTFGMHADIVRLSAKAIKYLAEESDVNG